MDLDTIRARSKMVAESPRMSSLSPKMSTFVHSIRRAHGGFRPLVLLAKTMVRHESGQDDEEDMLSAVHKYLRHNREDRDDFQV